MKMPENTLRSHLLWLLDGGGAHIGFDDAVREFPVERANERPPNVLYTPWHLLEHLRISQWDILEFVRDPEHASPNWPEGYWPARSAMADAAAWEGTVEAFRADLAALRAIVADPQTDFLAPLQHAPAYTILREVLLVADHNAYHIGEFSILREVMGTWP